MILKLNIQSIRDCDPQKLGQIDVRPHYVSRNQSTLAAIPVSHDDVLGSPKARKLGV